MQSLESTARGRGDCVLYVYVCVRCQMSVRWVGGHAVCVYAKMSEVSSVWTAVSRFRSPTETITKNFREMQAADADKRKQQQQEASWSNARFRQLGSEGEEKKTNTGSGRAWHAGNMSVIAHQFSPLGSLRLTKLPRLSLVCGRECRPRLVKVCVCHRYLLI